MDVIAKYKKPLTAAAAAAVILFSGYCLFYKLGNEPFLDYDEATYAEVTHESIAHGNPSGLSFLNQPYFRKPPLLFWMTTASERVITSDEFADRLPNALAGFAALIIVALVCIEAGAGVGTGVMAAAILGTTATWLEFARDVRFDNLVAFCIIAAFYAAVRALRDSRWFLMAGVMLALAVLAKSVIAVFGVVSILALLIHSGKLGASLRDQYFWYGTALFLLVLVPWHLYMTLAYGMAFWHSYLGSEVLQRASTNLFAGGSNPTNPEYIGYVLTKAAPWFLLFLVSLASLPLFYKKMDERARSVFVACLITVLSVLAVAFTAKTKAFGYLIPLYPFMAVALGLSGRELWLWARQHRAADTVLPVLIGCAIVLFAYAAALTRYEALHIDPAYAYEGQAFEERDVAAIIRSAPNPHVYAYGNYHDFGTILYYSRLPDTQNPLILLWSESSTPSATTTNFILASTSLSSLTSSFPNYHFVENYSGTFVSLFTVTSAR